MPKIYRTRIWQARLPETWSAESVDRDQTLVTVFKREGVGTLTVFAGDQGPPTDRAGRSELYQGRLRGSTWSSCRDDQLERYWTLWCAGHRLLVSYLCAAKNADLETSEVDEIVQSIDEAA